jgi:hypothetical protein
VIKFATKDGGEMMPDAVEIRLKTEIKATRDGIAEQRRLIKRSKGNAIVLEAAKAGIRQMQTHLDVLESNLNNLACPVPTDAAMTSP